MATSRSQSSGGFDLWLLLAHDSLRRYGGVVADYLPSASVRRGLPALVVESPQLGFASQLALARPGRHQVSRNLRSGPCAPAARIRRPVRPRGRGQSGDAARLGDRRVVEGNERPGRGALVAVRDRADSRADLAIALRARCASRQLASRSPAIRCDCCPRVLRVSFRDWSGTVVRRAAAVGSLPSDTADERRRKSALSSSPRS